jgi:hypothetical protein
LDLLLIAGLYLVFVLATVAFFFQRFRWRRRKRLGKSNWGYFPTSAAMGNALQQLSTMAQPQVEHVLEEKLAEDEQDDEESGPLDPVAHLQKQARKIQRGEKLGRLTTRWRP